MKRNVLYILALVVVAALVTVGCTSAPTTPNGQTTTQKSQDEIVLGFIGPLTGDAAPYGVAERNVVEMAVKELNANGGINGKPVRVIYEDDKCSGKDSTLAAQKLVNVNNVKLILGGVCSGETLAAAPITEQNKVILFSAFSSSPEVTHAGDYVFRTSPSDADAGVTAAKFLIQDGRKRIAFVTENTDYSVAFAKVARDYLKSQGIELVADEFFNSESKDYRAQLTKVKSANPDTILLMPQSGVSGGLLVKQATELGIDAQIYASNPVFLNKETYDLAGDSINGIEYFDAPGITSEKALAFLDAYTKLYGEPPHDWEVAARRDTFDITVDAIKACGDVVDPDCIKTYLYNMPLYDGLSGSFSFDENGDVAGMTYIAHKIVDAANQKTVVVPMN